MEIRKMTAREVPQVAELEKLCFAMPWSEKRGSREGAVFCWRAW